mgnify:CR=1 FL=1
MLAWIINNKEWFFSGIGVAIVTGIVSLIVKSYNKKMIQRSGKNSLNLQSKSSITINGDINNGTKSEHRK